jgi:transcriptional regulator with XRE-family HTH domain
MTHFTDWLDRQLAERGVRTSAEAARLFDMPQSTIDRWRTAKQPPTAATMRKIAEGLGVPVLQVCVAAGFLTAEEAGQVEVPAPVDSIPDAELVAELARRLDRARAADAPDETGGTRGAELDRPSQSGSNVRSITPAPGQGEESFDPRTLPQRAARRMKDKGRSFDQE